MKLGDREWQNGFLIIMTKRTLLGFPQRAREVFDMTFLLFVVYGTAMLRREPGHGASLATFPCCYLRAAVPE